MNRLLIIGPMLSLSLAGCQPKDAADAEVLAAPAPLTVDMARYRADVETLSADAFEGRSPSSAGEQKTLDYLVQEFKAAGLAGGNNGEFLQQVPLVAITAEEIEAPVFRADGEMLSTTPGEEVVIWTKRVTPEVALQDSELAFVGYGIVAPEYNWNDYADIDVAGKTVVMLVNDPGFASGDPGLFTGNKMTLYGRWTYKFEEAARQGAAGVILIHQTAPAGYPWGVVQGGWTGPQFDLVTEDGNAGRAAVESWISESLAERLFALAGLDFAALQAAAAKPGFVAVPMSVSVSTAIKNTLQESVSHNVVAVLPGEQPDESVALSAHWDHLGTVDNGDEDGIFNGAVDNATGTAALLEIARTMAGQKRRRSVVFIALTAEESGLLGSAWYARHPTVSLEKMAGLINIDAMNVYGQTLDVTVIGYGSSELEALLRDAAADQGRVLAPEPTPEKGFFYRSDHFNFAKQGVPVLYAKGGVEHIDRGREYGEMIAAEHIAERYHKPSDEIHEGWDFSGLEDDLNLYLAVVDRLASSEAWPRWNPGNEFLARREESRDLRD